MNKKSTNEILASFVRARRESLGLSQVQLAERSGLHHSYWSYLEAGRFARPSPEQLNIIARTLKVPLEDLYNLVGYQLPEGLPSLRPYLRAKYDLPPEAIAELERYFDFLRQQYGIPKGQPVFPPIKKTKTDNRSKGRPGHQSSSGRAA